MTTDLIAELLTTSKAPVISTPYDPIHLTHVGFDFNTGQCEQTGSSTRNAGKLTQIRHWDASRMAEDAR